MADEQGKPRKRQPKELSEEDLAVERGRPLPDREVMSTIDQNVAIPLDPALAADILAGEGPGEPEEADESEPSG
jgi:hypothetical protein